MGLAYFCLFHDALGCLRCSLFFESFRDHLEEEEEEEANKSHGESNLPVIIVQGSWLNMYYKSKAF